METIVLNAAPRTDTGSPESRRLRREGVLPGNIFGKGIDGSIPVQFDRREVEGVITKAATQIDADGKNPREEIDFVLNFEGKEYRASLGEIQREVISRRFSHVEFIVK